MAANEYVHLLVLQLTSLITPVSVQFICFAQDSYFMHICRQAKQAMFCGASNTLRLDLLPSF